MAMVPNAVEILPKIWTAWVGRTSITQRRQPIANDAKNRVGVEMCICVCVCVADACTELET